MVNSQPNCFSYVYARLEMYGRSLEKEDPVPYQLSVEGIKSDFDIVEGVEFAHAVAAYDPKADTVVHIVYVEDREKGLVSHRPDTGQDIEENVPVEEVMGAYRESGLEILNLRKREL